MLAGSTFSPYDPSRPVVYMHVPKSAGTSATRMLVLALGLPRSRFQFDLHHFGRIERPDVFAPECAAKVCFHPSDLRDEKEFLAGHFSLSTLMDGCPTAQYISTFREPVSRILSNWLFHRAVSDERLAPWGEEWAAIHRQARGTLADFLLPPTGAPQSDNLTVRMLLRPHPLIPEVGFIDPGHDEALLSEAIARLSRFSHIDLVTDSGAEAEATVGPNIAEWLGSPLKEEKLNEGADLSFEMKLDILAQLNDPVVELLESRARLDKQLWNYVGRSMANAKLENRTRRTITRYILSGPDAELR